MKVLISWLKDLVELPEKKGETEIYAEMFRGLIDYLEGSLGDRKGIVQSPEFILSNDWEL